MNLLNVTNTIIVATARRTVIAMAGADTGRRSCGVCG